MDQQEKLCRIIQEFATPTWFWSRVNRGAANTCWLWKDESNLQSGYARICINGHTVYGHQIAFVLMFGYLPRLVRRISNCQSHCVNPGHLYDPHQPGYDIGYMTKNRIILIQQQTKTCAGFDKACYLAKVSTETVHHVLGRRAYS